MSERAATQQELRAGDVLLGKYRVEEVIGIGGMGRVIKCQHLYLQQPVALKILLPQMAESSSTVARFLREAQATVRLRSEHIARVMDVGTMSDGTPFMVMEFLEGYDLNQILRHHGPQMAQAVVDLILQACEGLSEAHAAGIVHRDIKPSNFFITRRPDGSNLLKILDFGISKTPAEISELTGTQTVIGTPTYMAPEQMISAKSTDPRSDIWSMGVVMYQLLAGRPPFEAETYAQLVLKVGNEAAPPLHIQLPPGLQDIVLRCLEKKPENRIQTVGELARMLAPYASDPASAAQSAERATRILSGARGGQPGLSLGPGGGLPFSPPVLTPKSWNATNGSSLSGGAGQIGTRVVRKGRGLVIAGVATLCIGAGIGGFMIASSMKKDTKAAAHATDSSDTTTTTMGTTPTTGTATTSASSGATTGTTTGAATTGTAPGTATTGTSSGATTGTPGTATTGTSSGATTGTATPGTTTGAATTGSTTTGAARTGTATATTTGTQKTATSPASTSTASKTDATKSATKTDATKSATKTDATAAKTDASKSATTDASKTTAKTTKTDAKTDASKTATKTTKSTHTTHTTKTTKTSGGGLFDDRK